jgi:hypothetical protein
MERNVVLLLKDLCEDHGVQRSALFVITDDRQQAMVSQELEGATILLARSGGAKALVTSVTKDWKDDGPFMLVSYGRDVLELDQQDRRLRSLSFGRYRSQRARSRSARFRTGVETQPVTLATPVALAPEVATAAAAAEPAEGNGDQQHRNRVFGEILKKRRLGPFADHRGLVYDAIESLIESGQHHRVSELLDRAVAAAKERAEAQQKEKPDAPQMDSKLWNVIRKFAEQVFLDAQVLLAEDGKSIGRDWRSRSEVVKALAPKWRAAVDAQLILGLIDERNDISSLDGRNIARAIYHCSTEEAEGRVYEAVIYLLDKQVVEQTAEGFLRRLPDGPRIRAIS